MQIHELSLAELRANFQNKKISAVEMADAFLGRIEKLNPELNAFITTNPDLKKEADRADDLRAKGEVVGPLAGIPIGIKDMLCTQGLRTTAASKILNQFIPPYDSTVVAKIRKAGGLVAGKLNLDEFAMGSSNETSFFGPVHNPWKKGYVPGGSSGGSAAAMAARLVPAAIGTDTGGSIRQPAHYCGIVGIKPTYGRVSRYGIVAYASSLDQAGPMTSTVADAALMLEVISGHDSNDSTTSQRIVPEFEKNLKPDVSGLRVGVVREHLTSGGVEPEVVTAVQKAESVFRSAGAEIVEIKQDYLSYAIPVYYLVAASECSSNLARYDGVRFGYRSEFSDLSGLTLDEFYGKSRAEGFGREVKRRIMLGTYCLSSGYYDAYYNKACQVRHLIQQEYVANFQKCDFILSPVSTGTAFPLGGRIADPLKMYLNDIFTVSTNLAGLPGMSVPFAVSSEGLPIGVQLTGRAFDEQTILNAALILESANGLKKGSPL